jgi:protein dithiol oxidoreductase (disulfide-forming)
MKTFMVALVASILAPIALAQQSPFIEGKDYFKLEQTQPQEAPAGKIEVREFFSYGCPHCYEAEPFITAWKANMPSSAVFIAQPVGSFQPQFMVFAKAYFAAQKLKVAEKGNQALFEAIYKDRKIPQMNATIEQVAEVYKPLGVDTKAFVQIANSFAIQTKIKSADQALVRYGVGSTPTFVVGGKYRTDVVAIGGHQKLASALNFLIAKVAMENTPMPVVAPAPVPTKKAGVK